MDDSSLILNSDETNFCIYGLGSIGTSVVNYFNRKGFTEYKVWDDNKILRLKSQGLPSVNSYGTGDLLVHINLWTPQNISSDEKKFFEKAQKSKNFQPQPSKSDKSFFDRVKEMFS